MGDASCEDDSLRGPIILSLSSGAPSWVLVNYVTAVCGPLYMPRTVENWMCVIMRDCRFWWLHVHMWS